MSNHLAVATVTTALKQVVQDAISVVAGADTTTGRPRAKDDGTEAPVVNLFLYQVLPNPARRNADLPTRNGQGGLVERPEAALNLHYLVTFYGDEAKLEPQRLLGTTVSALHARPLLGRDAMADVIAAADTVGPADPRHYLGGSDLDRQVESVRFTPLSLTLEELSKLWSVFFQAPYALSVAYEGSVVLITAPEMPRTPLPVRRRSVTVLPFRQPVIERVEPQLAEPVAGAVVTLFGRNLRGDGTRVRLGGQSVPPAAGGTSAQLGVPLPAGLRAGVHPVRVVHDVQLGAPPPRPLLESNVAVFVLRPAITAIAFRSGGADRRIEIEPQPPVAPDRTVLLLLSELGAPDPRAFRLEARERDVESDPLVFDAGDLPAATYLARLRVDGAESALTVDGAGRYSGPSVVIP